MKKYNFNAGPSILPREVIEQTAQACLDFDNSGLSLMEISHRAKNFQPIVDEAVALFKELLNIPEGYSVLFLGGGVVLGDKRLDLFLRLKIHGIEGDRSGRSRLGIV